MAFLPRLIVGRGVYRRGGGGVSITTPPPVFSFRPGLKRGGWGWGGEGVNLKKKLFCYVLIHS